MRQIPYKLQSTSVPGYPSSPMVPIYASSPTQVPGSPYLKTFIRYAGVGIIGTTVHYLVMLLLIGIAATVFVSTIGAIAGCVVNFHLARRYVFARREQNGWAFRKFVTVAIAGVVLNSALMILLVPHLPAFFAQVICTGAVFLAAFFANDRWSFVERPA